MEKELMEIEDGEEKERRKQNLIEEKGERFKQLLLEQQNQRTQFENKLKMMARNLRIFKWQF
jgi:hypothetical protein